MCGIFGFFSSENYDLYNSRLKNTLDLLKKRGPDDQGQLTFDINGNKLVLCQTRLAIIDLSSGGHQPFTTKDGRFTLVFNGEIYNYLEIRSKLESNGVNFNFKSDTEVLLQAWVKWGMESLKIIDGMFSFVVFDKKHSLIHCIRDPYGIKPLYYYFSNNEFVFSSELPPINNLIRKTNNVNKKIIYNYLITGDFDNSNSTFFEKIYSLSPGNYLKIDLSNQNSEIQERLWYDKNIEKSNLSFVEAKDKLRYLFIQSVERQLRCDVPFGVSLSGGIDSSSIACCIKYLNPKINLKTFSYIADNEAANEIKWINIVNGFTKADFCKAYINDFNLENMLDDFIYAQGEPHGGLTYFAEFCIYKLAKKNGIKVLLDGHGADESIAGYQGYPSHVIREFLERGNIKDSVSFSIDWSKWPGRRKRNALSNYIRAILYAAKMGNLINYIDFIRKLLSPNLINLFNDLEHFSSFNLPNESNYSYQKGLSYKLNQDLTIFSCPPQLRGADRSAMWHSIENRVPFLSPEFVKFSLSLPAEYLVSEKGQSKYIFREAMRGIVPDSILDRRDKIGYQVPDSYKIPLTAKRKDLLLNLLDCIDFIDKNTAINLMTSNDGEFIKLDGIGWRIFNLLKWYQFHVVNL